MHHPAVTSYLTRHAEAEAASLAASLRGEHFPHVLVVPCYAETPQSVNRLIESTADHALLVLVVNAPDDAMPAMLDETHELLRALQQAEHGHVLVINRVDVPIPAGQGVGLARKIGADVALHLIAGGVIEHPWIYLTDADATLPADYFEPTGAASGTVLFPFRHHSPDPRLQSRADLYELHLRHYVRGLEQAGSAYAFPSLGSIVCVHADAYAMVRGVPRRAAGEDFYLLNKLAKVGPITRLNTTPVTLEARFSNRVPFGTGPALQRLPEDPERFESYAAQSFRLLAGVLEHLESCALTNTWTLPEQGGSWLQELGWDSFQPRLAQAPERQRQRRLTEWLDGFRTMRFIHLARQTWPDAPLLATLREDLGWPEATREELLTILRAS